MAGYLPIPGLGGSGSGLTQLWVKSTNDLPAVFISEANRDAYFLANPADWNFVKSGRYAVGIGPIPEQYPSVDNGYFSYDIASDTWKPEIGVQGPRGEKGDSGTTPSVIVEQVSAPNHGFVAQDVLDGTGVRRDGTDPRNWVEGSNASIETCASSLLAEIVDANNLLVILEGVAPQPSHGFVIGDIYYLGVNGRATNVLPTVGRVQQLFTVIDADNVLINIGQSHDADESGSYLTLYQQIKKIAEDEGIASGQAFSFDQANRAFSALGYDVEFKETNGRIAPTYWDANGFVAVWGGNHNDPTTDGALVEFSIDTSTIPEGREILFRLNRSSSSGTRQAWFYDGNPNSGGTPITPLYGDGNTSTAGSKTVKIVVPKNSNRIYVSWSRTFFLDMEFTPATKSAIDSLEAQTGTDRLNATAIDAQTLANTVYWNNNGDDTKDGRTLLTPVATLTQALVIANALPLSARRIVKGIGALSHTGDISIINQIDLDIPKATIIGNIMQSTASRCEIEVGLVQGNVTVSNGSHYKLGQLAGNLTITSGNSAPPYIHIQDYLTGTFTDASASGDVNIEIVHDSVGVRPALGTAGYNPYGHAGDYEFGYGNKADRSTGIYRGGFSTLVNGTTINITEGNGEIVSVSGIVNVATSVEWATQTFTPSVAVDGTFVITIAANGSPVAVALASYSEITRRDVLTLGAFEVSGGAIVSVTPVELSANEPLQQLYDFINSWGTVVRNGLNVTSNGANMQIDYSSGQLHFLGSGSQIPSNRQPNVLPITGSTIAQFTTHLGISDTQVATNQTLIDPSTFDNGGATPATIGGSLNRATVRRIYQLPAPNAQLVMMFGQTIYDSLDDAIAGDDSADFTLPAPFGAAVLRERIAMTRTCVSLQDPATARILQAPKYGTSPFAGAGASDGGGGATLPPQYTTTNLTPNGQRFVIATIDPVAAGTAPVPYTVSFDFLATNTSGAAVVNSTTLIQGIAGGDQDDEPVLEVKRNSRYPTDETLVKYSVERVTSDFNDGHIIVVELAYTSSYDVTIRSNRLEVLDPNVTFATQLVPHVDTGNEVPLETIDLALWQDRNIKLGVKGGIATDSVGDYGGAKGAHTNYENEVVTHRAGGADIQVLSSTGSRFSSGMFSTSEGWPVFPITDFPFDASPFETLVAQKRATKADTSLNPLSTITLTGIDVGGVTRSLMTGFDGAHQGLRFTTTSGTRGLEMTFADCFFQRIVLTMRFGVATSSGGATQDYELVDENGTQVAEWTILGPDNNVGSTHEFSYSFTSGAGDTQLTLRKRSTGTSQAVYMYDYDMNVFVDRPAQLPKVGIQFDDPADGTMLQRIYPDPDGHAQGTIALNVLASNRQIYYDGEDWAYNVTKRIEAASIASAILYDPDNGSLDDQGWTGAANAGLDVVFDHQGFDILMKMGITGSGHSISAPASFNTQAFWENAWTGLNLNLRAMFTQTAGSFFNIEPINTAGFWTAGRYAFGATINTGMVRITPEGGTDFVDIDLSEMQSIELRVPNPSQTLEGELWIGGNRALNASGDPIVFPYTGNFNGQRGIFIFELNDAAREWYIQSLSFLAMDPADLDVILTRQQIETGVVVAVPQVPNNVNIVIPKGIFYQNNNITGVNGGTGNLTLVSADDDNQVIYDPVCPPKKTRIWTQGGTPWGNEWNSDSDAIPVESNSVFLLIESGASSILYSDASGTFKGVITPSAPQTGQYTLAIAGHALSATGAYVNATAYNLAGADINVTAAIAGLGEVFIDIYDNGGNRVNDRVWVEIRWPL